jgi:hypothetical protein
MSRRTFLGNDNSIAERVRIYRTPEAIEVDQVDQYQIFRRRVFFDEVRLVTLHSKRGGALGWVLLALAGVCALLSLTLRSEPQVAFGFQEVAAALALLGAIGLMIRMWVVTVWGRRTRARVVYRMREGRAREVYGEICRAAADAQRALAREAGAWEEPPPPPPVLPLSASEPLPPPAAPLSPT